MTTIVRCARALVDGDERRDFVFAIESERIRATGSFAELSARFPDAQLRAHDGDVAVVPGFISGHSHAYQILMRGWADDLPFERWRSDALYKVVRQLSPKDVYWTFRLAFDEMLAAGITTVAEFFYLNGAGNAHAQEAIRAAADSGIRLVFARTWMDADYAPSAFRESIEQAQQRTAALMDEFPNVHICVAPHSLHAASPEMIRAAAEFANARDCMLHVHVAEAQYEGAQTLERFGETPISLLQRLNALSERTVTIHAIYITDAEKDLLAQSQARVVHNPMTNQYLGDGICDVTGLLERGVVMGLGTDADVKPSILDEMRSASLLQKIAQLDGSALGARQALSFGTVSGALALNVEAGAFREGAFADYAVIDASGANPWIPLVNHVVYRAESADVRETYVGGRRVRVRGERFPAQALEALRNLLPRLQL
ncbi:MAG TPA: amidohydrolase family protein [Candidatus Baltobacteraceae bacterium]|nr:amidohydrolase family protein [Candidatus Baltobacteraceae bacterium]